MGRNSITEMAEAALAVGYRYIAITDHSKILAMTGGLTKSVRLNTSVIFRKSIAAWRAAYAVFSGIEVDILADGVLDLDDEVAGGDGRGDRQRPHAFRAEPRGDDGTGSASHREPQCAHSLATPPEGCFWRREPFAIDMGAVLRRAAELGVVCRSTTPLPNGST